MSRIIEAKAVISGEDRLSKVLDGLDKRFKQVGKGAKVAAEVGKLGKELDRAAKGLQDIERFRGAQGAFAQARSTYRGAQAEVARVARSLDEARKAAAAFEGVRTFSKNGAVAQEMAAARRLVTDLERQLSGAQRAVKGAASAFDTQAAALKDAKRGLEGSGVAVGKLVAEEKRLEAAVQAVNAAYARQAGLQRTAHGDALAAGMGTADFTRQRQDAASRRMIEAMGAPSRAARAAAEARAAVEAEHVRRRATASGDLIAGMGGAGRIQADRIARGRYLTEGMSAPGRLARAERERIAEEAAEARAQRRAERLEAGKTIAAGGAVVAAHKGKDIAKSAIESAAEFDLAVRKQRVFTDISSDGQAGLLKQAKQIGQETQFSNIDVVKAQTAAMQGLPATFAPDLKAAVAEGIVGNVRNFSTLMETDLKDGTEIIRGYLQQAGKDISTKEKALFEANKATNQLVKMAKLGGMNGEDVKNFANYAISAATSSGLSTDTTMALGALARRGGLRGDVAGVAVRSMAGKLVSPTSQGLMALNAAGINFDNYVHMPDKLGTEGLEAAMKRRLGKGFTPDIRAKVDAVNNNKDLIGSRSKYVEAITTAVSDMLPKTKKGTVSVLESNKVAGVAGKYHKVSAQSVDAERLLDDAMKSNMSLAQLNAWLTDKHGGKGAITQRQWDEFKASRQAIGHAADDPDWAKKKADEVFAGIGGAVENLKGSFENLILTIGNANAGLVKWSADKLGAGLDTFSQLPEGAQQGLSLAGLGGAAAAGWWGTFRLAKTFLGLGGGAAGGAGAGAGAAGAGAGAAGAAGAGAAAAEGAAAGGAGVVAGAGGAVGLGLAGVTFGTAAGAAFAGYMAAKQLPKVAETEGPGAIDPGTGEKIETQIPQTTPWLRDWVQSKIPTWMGGKPDGGAIPVEVKSLPDGGNAGAKDKIDPSGQLRAQDNTLDKAATASATAANGGKPIEATVKPDQITAKVTEIPPVTGTATVSVDQRVQVDVHVDADWVKATARAEAKSAVASIPLASSGARPGAVSMPGAATTPGAK